MGGVYLGLLARDSAGNNESTQDRWKKFHANTAKLVVTFNSYPAAPANLTTSGAACGSTVGRTSPVLRAQYVDPDGSDTLTGRFEWRELPSGGVSTVTGPAKPANDYGEVTLSFGAAAEGRSYSWRVIKNDTRPMNPRDGYYTDVIGGANLTPAGDVSLVADARLIGGNSVSFDAKPSDGQGGYASTAGAVIDTTRSFSVAAWVRATATSGNHAAASQDGRVCPGSIWAYATTPEPTGRSCFVPPTRPAAARGGWPGAP